MPSGARDLDEVSAVKRLSRARELRAEWEAAVFLEIDELAAALERELERADATLLQELKRAGSDGARHMQAPPIEAGV